MVSPILKKFTQPFGHSTTNYKENFIGQYLIRLFHEDEDMIRIFQEADFVFAKISDAFC